MNNFLLNRPNQTALNGTIASDGGSGFIITAQIRHEIHTGSVVLGCISYFGGFAALLLLVGAWPKSGKSGFDLLMYHFIVLHFSMNFINQPSYIFLSEAVINERWIPANICRYIRPFCSMIEMNINVCDAEMALNRVVALFFPHHYGKWTTKPVVIGMIIFSWLICTIFYFIPLAYNSIEAIISMTSLGVCLWSTANSGIINVISFAMLIGVPYAVSGLGAVLISWKNWHWMFIKEPSAARHGAAEMVTPTRALRRRLRKSRMLLFTFIWTGLCITPGNVWAYGGFPSEIARQPMVQWWMKAPRTLQYSLTPCILLFYNDECRARLRGMIASRMPNRISTAGSFAVPGRTTSAVYSKE